MGRDGVVILLACGQRLREPTLADLGVWDAVPASSRLRRKSTLGDQTARRLASETWSEQQRRIVASATLFPHLSTRERTARRELPECRASIGAGLGLQRVQPMARGPESNKKRSREPESHARASARSLLLLTTMMLVLLSLCHSASSIIADSSGWTVEH